MVVWNPIKKRVLYREKNGKKVYPHPEDNPENKKAEPVKAEVKKVETPKVEKPKVPRKPRTKKPKE